MVCINTKKVPSLLANIQYPQAMAHNTSSLLVTVSLAGQYQSIQKASESGKFKFVLLSTMEEEGWQVQNFPFFSHAKRAKASLE